MGQYHDDSKYVGNGEVIFALGRMVTSIGTLSTGILCVYGHVMYNIEAVSEKGGVFYTYTVVQYVQGSNSMRKFYGAC